MSDVPLSAHPVVQVWWLDTRSVPAHATSVLSAEERHRVDACVDPNRARQRAGGSVLLRCAVAFLLGRAVQEVTVRRHCRHCSAPHGRPEVPASGLQLSVSHAGHRVAVAVSSSGPVGVDVEAPRSRPLSAALLRRALTAAEQEYLFRVPDDRRTTEFLRAWTAKEALLKASGEGLHGRMGQLQVDLRTAPCRLLSWGGSAMRAQQVRLAELDTGGNYVAALATIGVRSMSLLSRDGLPLVERMLG